MDPINATIAIECKQSKDVKIYFLPLGKILGHCPQNELQYLTFTAIGDFYTCHSEKIATEELLQSCHSFENLLTFTFTFTRQRRHCYG